MNKLVYVAINESGEILTEYGNSTTIKLQEPDYDYEYFDTHKYDWVPAMLIITDKD
jgi:hypothetical protein